MTRLVKTMGGPFTRNFVQYRFDAVAPDDFAGARAVLDVQYKLVVDGEGADENDGAPVQELYDIRTDDRETSDIAADHPDVMQRLDEHLQAWQQSILKSLTGAD